VGRGSEAGTSDAGAMRFPGAEPKELAFGFEVEQTRTEPPPRAQLKSISEIAHQYDIVLDPRERQKLAQSLLGQKSLAFKIATESSEHQAARVLGIAFSSSQHTGQYIALPEDEVEARRVLDEFRL